MMDAGRGQEEDRASSDGEEDIRLLGRCGIYCGACYILRAGRDGGILLDEVAEQVGKPREEIHCEGCGGPDDAKWDNCRRCEKTACMDARGYRTCVECPSFSLDSCEMLLRLQSGCQQRGEDPRAALIRVAGGEAAAWLKEQRLRWRCCHCHGPVHWYEEQCHHCGAEISRER